MSNQGSLIRLTLFGFAALAFVALLLLTLGAEETEDWFSWTIQPPLSAAALGAFYGAALVIFVSGARAPTAAAVRQVVPPALVIGTALLVVTLIHLDKFDLDSVFGVFWLCAYIVAPALIVLAVIREGGSAREQLPAGSLPRPLLAALALEGVAMAAMGLLMLASPDTAAEFWPWALTPLVARVFGSFLLGVSIVALLVVRDRVLATRGIAAAYVVLGALQLLAVATHSADLGADSTATAVYIGFFGLVLLTGLYGLASSRVTSP